MIKLFYKTIALVVCAFAIGVQTPAYAAAETTLNNAHLYATENYEIAPYADVIVLKTRIHNGVLQYRHWNETRGYWVEDDWTDLP